MSEEANAGEAQAPAPGQRFEVDRPGGGKLIVVSEDEVEVWEELRDRYIREYNLVKANDLALLGAILAQHLLIFRAEKALNGMVPQVDHANVPTGIYEYKPPKPAEVAAAQKAITTASKEIRELEQSLGIDKKTREAGGQHTVGDYVSKLKKAAHEMGVHIAERVLAYEKFAMELRWRLRVLKNGDDEDRKVHDISPEKICEWAEGQLADLEQIDKEYAQQKGKVFVGQL